MFRLVAIKIAPRVKMIRKFARHYSFSVVSFSVYRGNCELQMHSRAIFHSYGELVMIASDSFERFIEGMRTQAGLDFITKIEVEKSLQNFELHFESVDLNTHGT
jgi:hypothetical protein